jgi:hypothetical protein
VRVTAKASATLRAVSIRGARVRSVAKVTWSQAMGKAYHDAPGHGARPPGAHHAAVATASRSRAGISCKAGTSLRRVESGTDAWGASLGKLGASLDPQLFLQIVNVRSPGLEGGVHQDLAL